MEPAADVFLVSTPCQVPWDDEETNCNNVGKNNTINHPPVITIDRWYKPFPNGGLTIVLPCNNH